LVCLRVENMGKSVAAGAARHETAASARTTDVAKVTCENTVQLADLGSVKPQGEPAKEPGGFNALIEIRLGSSSSSARNPFSN
jgi:hypothetical protein